MPKVEEILADHDAMIESIIEKLAGFTACKTEIQRLSQENVALRQQIANVQAQPGPKGDPGQQGPPGPAGTAADTSQLAQRLQAAVTRLQVVESKPGFDAAPINAQIEELKKKLAETPELSSNLLVSAQSRQKLNQFCSAT